MLRALLCLVDVMSNPLRPLFHARPEPLLLVVCQASIDDGVLLDACAPAAVRVQADRPIDVAVAYAVEDTSWETESYSLSIQSTLDGCALQPRGQRWDDAWGWPHALHGHIVQRWRPSPGRHALKFRIEATYAKRPRGHREVREPPQSRVLAGSLEVEVA